MKHLLLFIAASFSISSYAQRSTVIHATRQVTALPNLQAIKACTGFQSNKQTATGDTVYMSHIALTDTITLYYSGTNSGLVHGMNSYGDKGFAERYDFSGADSSVKIIGLISRFGGRVAPNSVQMVNFHVWAPEQATVSVRPTLFNSGLPGSYLASKSVSFSELGISSVDTVQDSARVFMLSTPTPFLVNSFFIGYTVNYTWGSGMGPDTIGLYSNKDGERTAPSFKVMSTGDTTINNVNVTQYANGNWHDNAVDNFAISTNLFIFPIVVIGPSLLTSVNGISQGGFNFYGCYPNPANNATNIKISLPAPTDLSVQIMNMNGAVVRTINKNGLPAGEQIIALETAGLAAGDYVFFIRTGAGNGIANKVTIVK